MSRPRIAVTGRIPDAGLEMLRDTGDVAAWESTDVPSVEQVHELVRGLAVGPGPYKEAVRLETPARAAMASIETWAYPSARKASVAALITASRLPPPPTHAHPVIDSQSPTEYTTQCSLHEPVSSVRHPRPGRGEGKPWTHGD